MVVVTIGLIVFSPGTWRSWFGFGLLATAYAAALLTRSPANGSIGTGRDAEPFGRGSSRSEAEARRAKWRVPGANQILYPTTPFTSEQWRETALSLVVAAVSSCLLSTGVHFSLGFFRNSSLLPTPEMTALFTSTVLLASWAILLGGRCVESVAWCRRNRRKTFLLAGVLIGSLAFVLDQFLLVDYSRQAYFERSAVRFIGVHPLSLDGVNPTWLGYVIFFSATLFLHRWWLDMNPQRSRRLGLWRLFTAGVAAWLVSMIFAFPQGDAILWAATISAAVQLAAAWTPDERRSSFRGASS